MHLPLLNAPYRMGRISLHSMCLTPNAAPSMQVAEAGCASVLIGSISS